MRNVRVDACDRSPLEDNMAVPVPEYALSILYR